MLSEGSLQHVKQIALELHAWRDDIKSYVYFSQLIQGLLNAGFERWRKQHVGGLGFRYGKNSYNAQTNLNFINTKYI